MTKPEKKRIANMIRENFCKSIVLTDFTLQWAQKKQSGLVTQQDAAELSMDIPGLKADLAVAVEKLSAIDEYIGSL